MYRLSDPSWPAAGYGPYVSLADDITLDEVAG
jgi:hypothetical protein